jgi:hypothetical protein
MKALKVRPECLKLPLMLLKVVQVLFPLQGNATMLDQSGLRHEFGNLPVEAVALLAESLSLGFFVHINVSNAAALVLAVNFNSWHDCVN